MTALPSIHGEANSLMLYNSQPNKNSRSIVENTALLPFFVGEVFSVEKVKLHAVKFVLRTSEVA